MQEHQQIHQQELLHDNQLQQQLSPHSSLSQCVPTSISSAVPQIIQKVTPLLVDDSEETNFIHELKPVTTSIMHIHNQSNILDPQNSTTSMIQQSNRDDEPNRMDHRQTAKNLIEMRNAVPNPIQYNSDNNTFTAYYYY
uniref:Uncharacterized protein n=2 Tax=Arion vulgaris TaxID=1028688 RepID=A0A0B6Z719_9EUPU